MAIFTPDQTRGGGIAPPSTLPAGSIRTVELRSDSNHVGYVTFESAGFVNTNLSGSTVNLSGSVASFSGNCVRKNMVFSDNNGVTKNFAISFRGPSGSFKYKPASQLTSGGWRLKTTGTITVEIT